MNMKFIFGLMILSTTIHGAALQGQSFMVSNLDQEDGSFTDISSTIRLASSFTTGSEETTLQSMVVRLSDFDGGNEFVRIHSNSDSDRPGISYATFQDDYDDLGSNQLRFTPNGDVSLSAMTTYWVVFGGGDFRVDYTLSTDQDQTSSAGWRIGDDAYFSILQGPWTLFLQTGAYQFQINAIIPETSTYIFASGICLVAFATFRRIRIAKSSK